MVVVGCLDLHSLCAVMRYGFTVVPEDAFFFFLFRAVSGLMDGIIERVSVPYSIGRTPEYLVRILPWCYVSFVSLGTSPVLVLFDPMA